MTFLTKTELELLSDEKLLDCFTETSVTITSTGKHDDPDLIAYENLITEVLNDRISEFQQLINLCKYAAPLTPEEYPDLKYLPQERHQRYLVGHSLRHLSASTGAMQKMVENAEHGEPFDEKEVRRKVVSAMFTICKLCDALNIKGKELVWLVRGMANTLLGELREAEQRQHGYTNA